VEGKGDEDKEKRRGRNLRTNVKHDKLAATLKTLVRTEAERGSPEEKSKRQSDWFESLSKIGSDDRKSRQLANTR
jgi:hypothetical protein